MSPTPRAAPFELLERLGQGAMASVQLARRAGELVALKRPLAHVAEAQASLLHEARRLSLVQSPYVVRLLGTWEQEGETALVLEYVHSVSLAALLDVSSRHQRVLPVGVVLGVMRDVLAGLEALHESRDAGCAVLHGDVNPRNVLVSQEGHAKLCDLGLSMRSGERSPRFRGTAAYTSPEAAQGQPLSPASEVFSVGVMLWESLRAERLFRTGSEAETLLRVVESPITPLDHQRPTLRALAPVVSRALMRDPARRYTSAHALSQALLAAHPAATLMETGDVVSALVGPWLAERTTR